MPIRTCDSKLPFETCIRDMELHMTGKRELIEPHQGDKRYIRRDAKGRFAETVDVGRSLAQDRKRPAKAVAKKGHGDKGDRNKG